MNKLLLLSFCLLFFHTAICQSNDSANVTVKDNRYVRRFPIWFNPSRANEIDGISISGFISPYLFKADSLKIRGINIGIEPTWVFAAPFIVVGALTSPFNKHINKVRVDSLNQTDSAKSLVKITGLNIGICGSTIIDNNVNGLSLNVIGAEGNLHNGVSITLGANAFYKFNGISIAGLMNTSEKGSVVQISLFNYCTDCIGLQIGLWNKMGKRRLPFLNINLRKKKQTV